MPRSSLQELPDVGRLRLLREVARHGTIAATARAAGVTSSAVSQQLGVLERETGVRLLDRGPRGVALTGAGQTLVDQVDGLLHLLEQTRATMDTLGDDLVGRVRVGTIASAAVSLVLPAHTRLAESVPGVGLEVVIDEPAATIEAVVSGRLDVAVVDLYDHVPLAFPDYLAVDELVVEPLVLVAPTGSGLPRRPRLADLRHSSWVMPPEQAACGAAVRYACRAAGFEPTVRWETDDLLLLVESVARGVGVTLLPRLAVADQVADVALHTPAGPPLRRRILTVTRPATAQRPVVQAVLGALRPPSPR